MYLLTSIETHFKAVSYSETWCKTLMTDFLIPPPANYLIIINWKMLRTSQPLGANSGEMLNLDCRLETVINIIIIVRNDEPSGQVNRPLWYLQALPIKKNFRLLTQVAYHFDILWTVKKSKKDNRKYLSMRTSLKNLLRVNVLKTKKFLVG